jgi:putative dimethyl sulfoxide reductase chaperone
MIDLTPIDPHAHACDILGQVSRNRGLVYGQLALGFSAPDEDLIAGLRSGQMADELSRACDWLGQDRERLAGSLSHMSGYATTLSKMRYDYARLFEKSLDRVSPHESAYRWKDAGDLGRAGVDLRRSLQHQYSLFGVHCLHGREDHATVELEFMAYLCDREAIFWLAGSSRTARELRSRERDFVDDHLGRWLPEFCRRLRDRAAHSFYGFLAEFCDEWISLDQGLGYVPYVN